MNNIDGYFFLLLSLLGVLLRMYLSLKDKIKSMKTSEINFNNTINLIKQKHKDLNLEHSKVLKSLKINIENMELLKITNVAQAETASKITNKLLNDSLKFLISKLTVNNYEITRKKMSSIFEFCKKDSIKIESSEEIDFHAKITEAYKIIVKKDIIKLEQQRIKDQIREESRAQKERDAEVLRYENQQFAIEEALNKALKQAKDKHSVEVESLRQKLTEAINQTERVKSQAQLTKAGHVYVISNLGAFGDNIYKVGMTRRLDPMDRVKELGDASVPFPFDVHMMISSDNAPALESALHKELHKFRTNKVNLRREFFSIDLEAITSSVIKNHGRVEYLATPEALQFRETLAIEEFGKEHEYFKNLDLSVSKFPQIDANYKKTA